MPGWNHCKAFSWPTRNDSVTKPVGQVRIATGFLCLAAGIEALPQLSGTNRRMAKEAHRASGVDSYFEKKGVRA
jgi:hypothetical protein